MEAGLVMPDACGDENSLDLAARVIAFIRSQGRPAWLVGGYVRDRILCRPSHDLDVAVPSGAISLVRGTARLFGGASFVLDAERDVARAILPGPAGASLELDVARLRVPDLLDDLAYRDFTVNAIAADLTQPDPLPLYDPFDGAGDIDRKLLRAVTEGAFVDDPLRMLRGVRMAAELDFRIEDATYNLIRRDAPLLHRVSPERVRDELVRIVKSPGAWRYLFDLKDLALLQFVLPESAAQIGVSQSPPHYQDVFDHTRSVVAHLEGLCSLLWPEGGYTLPIAVPGDGTVIAPEWQWEATRQLLEPFGPELRSHLSATLAVGSSRRDMLFWAAIAHDWGKPAKRVETEDGRTHFYDHDRWGALLAETRLQALRFSGNEVAYVARLTDLHMRPGHLAHDFPPSRRAFYRFFRDAGNTGPDCFLLSLADHLATHASRPEPDAWQRRLSTSEMALDAFFRHRLEHVQPLPLLNGRQVMAELGLSPGPYLGELLEGLREAQATGEVTGLDEAWAWLRTRVGK